MSVFEENGQRWEVDSANMERFTKDHPNATTIQERDGKQYKVSAANWDRFLSDFSAQEQPTTAVDDAVQANQANLGQLDDTNPYHQWLNEYLAGRVSDADEEQLSGHERNQRRIDRIEADTATLKAANNQAEAEALLRQQAQYDALPQEQKDAVATKEKADQERRLYENNPYLIPPEIKVEANENDTPEQIRQAEQKAIEQTRERIKEPDDAEWRIQARLFTPAIEAQAENFAEQGEQQNAAFEQRVANMQKSAQAGFSTVRIDEPFAPSGPLYTNATGQVYTSKIVADMDNTTAVNLIQGQAEAIRERKGWEQQLSQWQEELAQAEERAKSMSSGLDNAYYAQERANAKSEVERLRQQIEGAQSRIAMIDRGLQLGIDPSINSDIQRQQAVIDELQAKMDERKKEVLNSMDPTVLALANNPRMSAMGLSGAVSAALNGDKQYAAYKLALDTAKKTLQALQDQKERNEGGDIGFWREFGRTVSDISNWDFGIGDLADSLTKLSIARGDFSSPEQQAAAEAVLQQLYYNQLIESQYGGNRGYRERGGQMFGQMIPFMLDFLIAGGEDVVARGITKLGTRAAERLVGETALKGIERGFFKDIAEGGLRAFGRELTYYIPKYFGVAVSDLWRAGKIMALTQPLSIASDIIGYKLGDVVESEEVPATMDEPVIGNGELRFANDATWEHAVWTGLLDNLVEDYSEMFGMHLGGIFTRRAAARFANIIGAKQLTRQLLAANAGSLGGIMDSTNKMFARMGINDTFGEITEEYWGQALRSALKLDTAYYYDDNGERKNLFTSNEFNAEIWTGMGMSMGLMEVMRNGISGVSYARLHHALNKKGKVAQAMIGEDRWNQLKQQIDDSSNDQMGATLIGIHRDAGLSMEQRAAATDYIAMLMAMRGMNLAQEAMAAGRQMTRQDIRQASGQQRQNQNYLNGYNTTDAQGRSGIQNLLTITMQQLNEAFGTDEQGNVIGNSIIAEINALLNDPVAIMAYIAQRSQEGGWGENEATAVENYANAKQMYDGMIQRSRDDIDSEIAGEQAKVDSSVNKKTGMIVGATMKDGSKVFVIDGVVVPLDDRTGIDTQHSDGSVMVKDQNTGEVKMVAVTDIQITDDETVNPEDRKQQIETNLRKQREDEVARQVEGRVEFKAGETYSIIGEDGLATDVTITPNENGVIDNGDGTVNVSDDGGQTIRAVSKDAIQQSSDRQGLTRAANAVQWEDAGTTTQTQGGVSQTPEQEGRYGLGKKILIKDADGEVVEATILSRNSSQNNYRYQVQVNGQVVEMTEDQLDEAYISDAEDTAPEQEKEKTALERIPVNEQGQHIYENAPVPIAWDALVEQCKGDIAKAQKIANAMVRQKEKALAAAQKAQASQEEQDFEGTPDDIGAEMDAQDNAVAQAQKELDFWNAVAGEQQRRTEEQAQQQAPQTPTAQAQEEETPQEQMRASTQQAPPTQQTTEQGQPQSEVQRLRQQAAQRRQENINRFADNLRQWLDSMKLNTPVQIARTQQELMAMARQIDERAGTNYVERLTEMIRRGTMPNAFMVQLEGESQPTLIAYAPAMYNSVRFAQRAGERMENAMERGQQVLAHEIVAHVGLRSLGTDEFNRLCDEIYKGMSRWARDRFVAYHWDNNMKNSQKNRLVGEAAAKKPWRKLSEEQRKKVWDDKEAATELRRGAADEYAAHLAEKVIGNETLTAKEQSIWEKIVSAIKKLFGVMDDTAIADALVQARDNLRQAQEAEPQIIGEEGERFSVEEQERILSNIQGQKQVGVDYDLTPAQMQEMDNLNDEVRFSSKEDRLNRLGGMIRNMRPDMSDEQRNTLLDYVEGLRKEENGATMEIATLKWYLMGNIRIPEDMQEVRRVVAIGKKAGVDVTDIKRFPTPESVVDEFPQVEVKEPPINPDEVDTLTNKKTYPHGITVYDVENSYDGRMNMRHIIDTHLGKDHNPWCLLEGNGYDDLTSDSEGYWYKTYTRFAKKVAFKDGKLIAFFAAGKGEDGPTWWDVQDRPHEGIPVTTKLEDGRTATMKYNIPIEDIKDGEGPQLTDDDYWRLDDLDEQIDELEGEINLLDERIDELDSEIEDNDNRLAELDPDEASQEDIDELEEEKEALEKERDAIEKEKDEKQSEIDELEGEKNEIDDSLDVIWNDSWRKGYKEGDNNVKDIHKGNKKNGDYTEWWDLDGNHIKEQAHYKDGKLVGEYRSYHEDGSTNVTCTYNENGNLEGEYIQRYPNGVIQEQAWYKDGKQVGPYRLRRWEDGSVKAFVQANEEGRRNGISVTFAEEGPMEMFYSYKNNMPVGKCGAWVRTMDANISPYQYCDYGDGSKTKIESYRWIYSDNKLREYSELNAEGKANGITVEYDAGGAFLEQIVNQKDDEWDGARLTFRYHGRGYDDFEIYKDNKRTEQYSWLVEGQRWKNTRTWEDAPAWVAEEVEATMKAVNFEEVQRKASEAYEEAKQFRSEAQRIANETIQESLQEPSEVRFSVQDMGEEERLSIRDFLLNGEVVKTLTGNEFPKDNVPLTEKVANYYQQEYGGEVTREGAGTVLLDKQSVRDSLGHGRLDRRKAIAFAAVPEIIKYGRIADVQDNWKGRDYESQMIVAPIAIGDNRYIGIVIIKKGKQAENFRFYLHRANSQKNLLDELSKTAFAADTHQEGIANILRFIVSPNRIEEKNTDNGEFNTPQGEAEQRYSVQEQEAPQNEDLFARAERIANNYQQQREQERRLNEADTRMSIDYQRMNVADWYERRMHSTAFQSIEAFQDSMRSLMEVMEKLYPLKKGQYVEDIPGFENAYLGENRLSSVNDAELGAVRQLLVDPLMQAASRLTGGKMRNYETLVNYMMAKHGLERNRYMAERDAQRAFDDYQKKNPNGTRTLADFINEARQKDYAGLTALTGVDETEVADAERLAQQMVDDYENSHDANDIKNLWDRTKALTDMSLSKQYESGFLTRANYDYIRGMYQYYIPLRGFDEKTSEEEYAYLGHPQSLLNGKIQRAFGRKSKADDPFVVMQAMAESSVMSGNRNVLVKQRFMNFVMNHPSDLVSISELWLHKNDATGEWEPVLPPQDPDDMAQWEQTMQQNALNEPDKWAKASDTVSIPYRVLRKGQLQEHQIVVRRGGRDYILSINGNPRLAQAINGQTNPDTPTNGNAVMTVIDFLGSINRAMSGFYTTMSPDFIVSNFCRDMIYSNSMVWVKESPHYALQFHKNVARANPIMLKVLLAKHRHGTLDMNNDTERMFKEFMENGGETGYARRADAEELKRRVEKSMRSLNEKIPATEIRNLVATVIGEFGRSVEMVARFAAFMTSREEGRDIDRCIYDGKEISVNFNKKGSGDKFLGAKGQTFWGNASSLISGLGRDTILFWNASLQGTFGNFFKNIARHPKKGMFLPVSYFALGLIRSYLGAFGSPDDGDDDDDDSYFNFPIYTRRSNFMIKGLGKAWIKIPLSIEYRSFYGMGEMMGSAMFNGEKITTNDYMEQLCQLLPVDMTEGRNENAKGIGQNVGNWLRPLIPASIKPLFEVGLNYTFTGQQMYREPTENTKNRPAWTRAYPWTNPVLVKLSRRLNEMGGGDEVNKGNGIDITPEGLEYLMKSYVPFFPLVNEIINTTSVIEGKKELDWRYIPLACRVMANGDIQTANAATNRKYFNYLDEYSNTGNIYNDYRRHAKKGDESMAKKLKEFEQTPEWCRHEAVKSLMDDITKLYKDNTQLNDDITYRDLTDEQIAQNQKIIEDNNKMRRRLIDAVARLTSQIQTLEDYEEFQRRCRAGEWEIDIDLDKGK